MGKGRTATGSTSGKEPRVTDRVPRAWATRSYRERNQPIDHRKTDVARVQPPHVDTEVREEAGFAGPAKQRIFTFGHLPAGRPIGGVLICSPLHAEFQTNYRREVLLARTLAVQGCAVQRFHYYGTGHSFGTSAEMTIDSMVQDANTALHSLAELLGDAPVGVIGSRFGALIAARVSASLASAPLAMWEPVNDGARYFKDAMRASLVLDLKEEASEGRTTQAIVDDLQRDGFVDLLGYSVQRRLCDSAAAASLAESIGDRPRSVLILQLGPQKRMRREFVDLSDDLTRAGFSVETRILPGKESWWFSNEPTRAAPLSRRAVDATAEWFTARFREAPTNG